MWIQICIPPPFLWPNSLLVIIRVNMWDTAKNTILSHSYYIKLLPHYYIRNTNLFHYPLWKMQSYPFDILPLNTCPIEVHVIYVPKFLPYKARFEYQKWVHFEESSSHKKEMCRNYSVQVPFPIEFWMWTNLLKSPQKIKFTKSKLTMFNSINFSLTWK